MGANSTQAIAIALSLVAMVLLAGFMAGGGFLTLIPALALFAASAAFFMKCKPWENQE